MADTLRLRTVPSMLPGLTHYASDSKGSSSCPALLDELQLSESAVCRKSWEPIDFTSTQGASQPGLHKSRLNYNPLLSNTLAP